MEQTLSIIARLHNDFPDKFGLPRQAGLVKSLSATIVLELKYRDANALRGIEGFSHIWLLWGFSAAPYQSWQPTVRPPRMGGNERMGVFATRAPFRPNQIGLSCVKLERVGWQEKDGPILHISGADMMDNTPIYDIKPYLPFVDSIPEARGGFAAERASYQLQVEIAPNFLMQIPEDKRATLIGVLEQDPRPAYQNDPLRMYGLNYAGLNICFTVSDGVLTVCGVSDI